MAKKMLIDATHAEETRVVVADGNKVEEFDFESENKRQLAGNIYLAKVTRVEPSLQAAFVDYGGNRHGFLAFSEIHPDYYQIPVADREALIAEELEYAKAMAEEEEKEKPKRSRSRSRSRKKSAAEDAVTEDAVVTAEPEADAEAGDDKAIPGMDVVDLDEGGSPDEASSPMETVADTPVETPEAGAEDEDATASDDASDGDAPQTADAASEDKAGDEAGDKAGSDAAEAETDDAAAEEADDDSDEEETLQATDKDANIESVAQEDVTEEIRAPRKPRPRRYKIQEVIKVRQILLVQVVKEERGNKGAALTTYLSLAGRYCVLMPNTARGGGISRKITNAADRKKLKEIANEIDVPQGAGLIVRTAGAKRTKTEIKRDYEYLQRHWEQIRELTLKSIAPAPIYEEGDLIKRSIRDLYNREIDEVLVEGEAGYRTAKDFMKMIMPSHAKNVKHYTDPMPLFARYQVESYLSGMFNPTVQLKSGGYIVIGITEALVAVDVNSGRATKEGSIEQTALNTNLEAAEEVARQMRLRDLAGLIVIDFIDMEERRNNNAVEKRLKDKLKTDRARIQVGRISGFGLLEMSRQRLRPGMLEATTQPCPSCHGTGLIRSDESLALSILRQLEEEGTRKRSREVLLKAPVAVVNYLVNAKREHIAQIEARYGMSVRVEGDPHKVSPDFEIEKFKTATRVVHAPDANVISMDSIDMSDMDAELEVEDVAETPAPEDEEQPPKRKRRRRRGGRGRSRNGAAAKDAAETSSDETATEGAANGAAADTDAPKEAEAGAETTAEAAEGAPEAEAGTEAEAKPKSRRRRRSKAKTEAEADAPKAEETAEAAGETAPEAEAAEETPEKPAPKKRRSRKKTVAAEEAPAEVKSEESPAPAATPEAEATPEPVAEEKPEEKPKRRRTRTSKPKPAAEPEPVMAEEPAAAEDAADKPKRKGWWSLGR
ncbi:MAG: ribonuclease E/G [Paracoccaceae bacterium]